MDKYLVKGGSVMPDYKEMYKRLFQAQTFAIEILQKAQKETEEMYISGLDESCLWHDSEQLTVDN